MTKVFKRVASWAEMKVKEARAQAEAREYGRVDGILQKIREGGLFAANCFLAGELVLIAIALSEGVMPIQVDWSTISGGIIWGLTVIVAIISMVYLMAWLPISTCRKQETVVRFIIVEALVLVIVGTTLISERIKYGSLGEFEAQQIGLIEILRIGWMVAMGVFVVLAIAVKVPAYLRKTRGQQVVLTISRASDEDDGECFDEDTRIGAPWNEDS